MQASCVCPKEGSLAGEIRPRNREVPPGLKRDSDHVVDTDLGPGTLWSIEIDKRPEEEFRQGFIETCAAAPGRENK